MKNFSFLFQEGKDFHYCSHHDFLFLSKLYLLATIDIHYWTPSLAFVCEEMSGLSDDEGVLHLLLLLVVCLCAINTLNILLFNKHFRFIFFKKTKRDFGLLLELLVKCD